MRKPAGLEPGSLYRYMRKWRALRIITGGGHNVPTSMLLAAAIGHDGGSPPQHDDKPKAQGGGTGK